MLVSLFGFAFGQEIDDNPYASCAPPAEGRVNSFIANGGFLVLIAASALSLFAMAHVCEEYFVPALEIFCRRWNVPDSVAGSLVMAAGKYVLNCYC